MLILTGGTAWSALSRRISSLLGYSVGKKIVVHLPRLVMDRRWELAAHECESDLRDNMLVTKFLCMEYLLMAGLFAN